MLFGIILKLYLKCHSVMWVVKPILIRILLTIIMKNNRSFSTSLKIIKYIAPILLFQTNK